MTQVYGQVDLVVFGYINDGLFVLHVDGNKLVADLWSVLCIVDQAELL